MKADVQYNDFVGSAAADISDFIGTKYGNSLKGIGKYFNVDQERLKIVGISIYGTENFNISLYCVDTLKSNEVKEHIVNMSIPIPEEDNKEILDLLFKRLHIVLHSNFDDKYPNLDDNEEVDFYDYHNNE